jgi:transcriptional regulator with XRE-family HTH domain
MTHDDKEIEAEMLRIGKQLHELRESKGIGVFQVLRLVGMNGKQLHDIESGNSNYTIVTLLKMKKMLGLKPDYEQAVLDCLRLINVLPEGTDFKEYGPEIFKRLTGKELS